MELVIRVKTIFDNFWLQILKQNSIYSNLGKLLFLLYPKLIVLLVKLVFPILLSMLRTKHIGKFFYHEILSSF